MPCSILYSQFIFQYKLNRNIFVLLLMFCQSLNLYEFVYFLIFNARKQAGAFQLTSGSWYDVYISL